MDHLIFGVCFCLVFIFIFVLFLFLPCKPCFSCSGNSKTSFIFGATSWISILFYTILYPFYFASPALFFQLILWFCFCPSRGNDSNKFNLWLFCCFFVECCSVKYMGAYFQFQAVLQASQTWRWNVQSWVGGVSG